MCISAKAYCVCVCICATELAHTYDACLLWCGGRDGWIIDCRKRSGKQEEEEEEEDRVFLRGPGSSFFKLRKSKHRVAYSLSVTLCGRFLSAFICILSSCVFRVVGQSSSALSRPFLGHLLLWSLVKTQPRFAAFFNTVIFLLRRFSLTTKLFWLKCELSKCTIWLWGTVLSGFVIRIIVLFTF